MDVFGRLLGAEMLTSSHGLVHEDLHDGVARWTMDVDEPGRDVHGLERTVLGGLSDKRLWAAPEQTSDLSDLSWVGS